MSFCHIIHWRKILFSSSVKAKCGSRVKKFDCCFVLLTFLKCPIFLSDVLLRHSNSYTDLLRGNRQGKGSQLMSILINIEVSVTKTETFCINYTSLLLYHLYIYGLNWVWKYIGGYKSFVVSIVLLTIY